MRQGLPESREQFAHYLKLMHHRAHEQAHGPCFIIFEERRPSDAGGNDELTDAKHLVGDLLAQSLEDTGIVNTGSFDASIILERPDDGWREDDSQNRYIQFSFERNWFCMDMPRETLWHPIE